MIPWLRVLKALLRFCARDRARAAIVGCQRVCEVVKPQDQVLGSSAAARRLFSSGLLVQDIRAHHRASPQPWCWHGKFSAQCCLRREHGHQEPMPWLRKPTIRRGPPLDVFYRWMGTRLSGYNRGTKLCQSHSSGNSNNQHQHLEVSRVPCKTCCIGIQHAGH